MDSIGRDATDEAQFHGLVRKPPYCPMIMPIGDRTTGDGDQVGRLLPVEGVSSMLLHLIVQDRFQSADRA